MEKLTWWQTLGSGGSEISKINEAADEINALADQAGDLRKKIRRLFELDRDQGRALEEVKITVEVLIAALARAGVLDVDQLTHDVRTEIEARFAPPPRPGGPGGPYRQGPAPAPPPERKVLCLECECEVPISQTYVTAHGEICDRCYVLKTSA